MDDILTFLAVSCFLVGLVIGFVACLILSAWRTNRRFERELEQVRNEVNDAFFGKDNRK